jgi:hypothetical protein
MLRISLQRFAQFARGRIRRGGHDSAIYLIVLNQTAPLAVKPLLLALKVQKR